MSLYHLRTCNYMRFYETVESGRTAILLSVSHEVFVAYVDAKRALMLADS